MSEKFEVEWIGTATKMMQVLDRLDGRLDKQEKSLQKIATTSTKSADAAAGSFNKLEAVLKQNEAALKGLSVGSKEFDTQLSKVERLRAAFEKMKATLSGKQGGGASGLIPQDQKNSINDIARQLKAVEDRLKKTANTAPEFKKLENVYANLKKRHDEMLFQLKKLGTEAPKVAVDAAGSFNKLEQELKDNIAAMNRMTIGTKEFAAQKAKVDQLKASFADAKKNMAGVGEETPGLLQSGLTKIAALAAGMVSFQAVVSAVVAELEKAKQLKLDASQQTKTFEQALADVGQNIGAGAVPQAKQMILENAPKLGTTQEGLANLIGIGISAGAKDLEEAMALSAAALKLTVGDANKAAALVGGTLDVASLGGSKNFEGALGQLLQTQSQVRSTNLAEFAANIGPGLAAATAQGQNQQGVSTERALEIASVISQVIKDPTGSNTATTMRQFFTRLDSFAPERQKTLDDGGVAKVSREAIDAFKGAKTFDERLQMMRENEGLMLQFMETQRESIGKTAVREIVSQSPRAVEFENKAKQNIQSIDAAQGFFTDLFDVVGKETAQLTASRKSEALIARSQVTGNRDLEGTVIKIVDDALSKVNLSGIDTDTKTLLENNRLFRERRGTDPIASGIATLEEAQQRRRGFGIVPIGGAVSAEDRALLQEQVTVLKELKALIEGGQKNPIPVKVNAPAARPKEAPLPAATAP